MKLRGKVAIVTGSSTGIGRAISLALGAEGATVVVNFRRSRKEAEEVVKEIVALGSEGFAFESDVSKETDVKAMLGEVIRRFSRIDVLVNNAGHVSKEAWFANLEDIGEPMWQRIMDVDLKGTFLCSKQVAPYMLKQGSGKIINVSSTPALTGDTYGIVYSVAKAGILGLTKTLARLLAPKVQVNVIALGSMETRWTDWLDKKYYGELLREIPMRRFGKPDEVGKVALFLASSDSDYITGQTVVVDGGAYMH